MLQDHIIFLRSGIFLTLIILFIGWEYLSPRHTRRYSRIKRWPAHIMLTIFNSVAVYLLLPITAATSAIWATQSGWGLFQHPVFQDAPIAVVWAICFLALDFSVYAHHVLFHHFGFLWPYHAMHHSDEDLDATSGIRFHPIEIFISMIYKAAIITLLGAPIAIVIIFEVALNGCALFTHANIKLSPKIDRICRWVFVTPDMHRIHHSIDQKEQNTNFGFCLSLWDRICGTYKSSPNLPEDSFPLGLKSSQKGEYQSFTNILKQPFMMIFKKKKTG